MAEVAVVQKTKLPIEHRLDPEYYRPVYLELESKLICVKPKKVSEITEKIVSFGAYALTNHITYQEKGIPYLRCIDIKSGRIDLNNVLFIDSKAHDLLWKSEIKPNQVLLTMSGTVGNAAVASTRLPYPINSNQDIAKITLKKGINPHYFALFFNTKYGRFQTERSTVGSIQQHLFLWQIEELLVPILDIQDEIANLAIRAENEMNTSLEYFKEAILTLEKELELTKIPMQTTYLKNSNEVLSSKRLDAEYYQPAYEQIENHLRNKFNAKPIGNLDFISVTTGQYSDEYVEKSNGKPYVRGTDIINGTIDTESLVYIPTHKQNSHKKAKENDVVTTRVGSIGLSAVIPSECDGGTISDNLIRLRFDPKQLDPHYLVLYLESFAGKSLLMKNSRGSVQQRLNQETLKDVVIPILPKNIQNKLSILIKKSFKTKIDARQLLELAKKKVEERIESKTG